MVDNITIYVCKSMVTYCCCVHTAVPAAYSMLYTLYNEYVFVINVALYCYNTSYNIIYYGRHKLHRF